MTLLIGTQHGLIHRTAILPERDVMARTPIPEFQAALSDGILLQLESPSTAALEEGIVICVRVRTYICVCRYMHVRTHV